MKIRKIFLILSLLICLSACDFIDDVNSVTFMLDNAIVEVVEIDDDSVIKFPT